MMNVKGSEPHRRLKVLAAVKDSFSPIGQGIAGHRLTNRLNSKIHSEVSSGRVSVISLPSSSVSCTEYSTINRYLNSRTTCSFHFFKSHNNNKEFNQGPFLALYALGTVQLHT